MPSRYAIANWKMNLPQCGMDAYFQQLKAPTRIKVVVAPPFPYLKELRGRTALAGQNCADQPSGAFTGEVSAMMLRDCGATFVIVGHSERRNIFGETDAIVARKLSMAIEARLTPILCVGEPQRVRDDGQAAVFVANQIKSVAVEQLELAPEIFVAYEPVWAIGTGRNATGEMVEEMVDHIREALSRFWPSPRFASAPVLYGGSVTPENVEDLCRNGRIDGFLVGGASLDPLKFSMICEVTALAGSA
jgi:triosephosphate isomerase (TIM)